MTNTQVHKKKEQKNQLEANNISPKQRGSVPTIQFVDNRPLAMAQGKLQKIASNSSHEKKSRRFQEMANSESKKNLTTNFRTIKDNDDNKHHQPTQEKANRPALPGFRTPPMKGEAPLQRGLELDPGKINIAGEKHPEISDERRVKEKEFVTDSNYGAYWTEAEPFDQNAFYGDDPFLRAVDALNATRQHMDAIRRGGFLEHEKVTSWAGEVDAEMLRIVDKNKKREIKPHAIFLKHVAFKTSELMEKEIRKGTTIEDERVELYEYIDIGYGKLTAWLQKTLSEETSADVISGKRSQHMWTSALTAASKNLKGVWKVGNDHIGEMEGIRKDEKSVTLTDKYSFDKEFNVRSKPNEFDALLEELRAERKGPDQFDALLEELRAERGEGIKK